MWNWLRLNLWINRCQRWIDIQNISIRFLWVGGTMWNWLRLNLWINICQRWIDIQKFHGGIVTYLQFLPFKLWVFSRELGYAFFEESYLVIFVGLWRNFTVPLIQFFQSFDLSLLFWRRFRLRSWCNYWYSRFHFCHSHIGLLVFLLACCHVSFEIVLLILLILMAERTAIGIVMIKFESETFNCALRCFHHYKFFKNNNQLLKLITLNTF